MFCLRTWLPVLFFVSNVPPLYLILFISAMYYLNRPCVYCSLLITILLIALYDFHNNWFEPQPDAVSPSPAGNSSTNAVGEGLAVATSAIQSAATSVAQSVAEGFTRKTGLEIQPQISASEWLKELLGKKEWRIPCIDVAVRL